MIMAEHKKTSFFYDNSEGNPAELLIDYFMSWTLRCAIDTKPDNISETLHKSAKYILHFLLKDYLGDKKVSEYTVVDVEALKQWKQIDLLCSVQLRIDNDDRWYVLAFENKMYTKLHDNQLERYEERVNKRYPDTNIKKKFIYLTSHAEVPEEDEVLCSKSAYTAYPISEIASHLREKNLHSSGNALFDEFWHNFF